MTCRSKSLWKLQTSNNHLVCKNKWSNQKSFLIEGKPSEKKLQIMWFFSLETEKQAPKGESHHTRKSMRPKSTVCTSKSKVCLSVWLQSVCFSQENLWLLTCKIFHCNTCDKGGFLIGRLLIKNFVVCLEHRSCGASQSIRPGDAGIVENHRCRSLRNPLPLWSVFVCGCSTEKTPEGHTGV